MKFKGPRIPVLRRWWNRIALKLGIKKPEQVYTSVGEYHKQLMRLSNKELVTRVVYLSSKLYTLREAIPDHVYQKFKSMPKRKLVKIVIDLSVAVQQYGSIKSQNQEVSNEEKTDSQD